MLSLDTWLTRGMQRLGAYALDIDTWLATRLQASFWYLAITIRGDHQETLYHLALSI